MRIRSALALFGIVALLVVAPACAARGVRNQVRVGSLTVGEAVKGLDRAETDIATSTTGGYTVEAQEKVNTAIATVARAARAYERAAKAWPTGGPVPKQVVDASTALTSALADLEHIIPALAAIHDPLMVAVTAVRAALATSLAGQAPLQGALPSGGVLAIFAMAQLIAKLVASGRTTFEAIKKTLQQHGATDAELDAMDVDLTEIIDRRES